MSCPISSLRAVAVSLVTVCALGASSAHAADFSDQIIVRHRAASNAAERAQVRADAGVQLEQRLPLAGTEVVVTDGGSRAEALDALRDAPDVLWAEPDREVRIASEDPYWPYLWSLQNLGPAGVTPTATADADVDAPEAWAVSKGSGVTVGVVDSGVRSNHPDLAGQLVPGAAFGTLTTTEDANGHGTHVAGIIAALADNDEGIVGAAPLAKVKPLRALGADGSGSTSAVSAAFAAAGDDGLRVVNASLGSSGWSNAEYQALATHQGTLYVVAAGNDGLDVDGGGSTSYPCKYTLPNVLCVGASDNKDARAIFDAAKGKASNVGVASVDLFAPGAGIWSTYFRDPAHPEWPDYVGMSGTSMAAPLVAAAAALVASANPTWSAAQIKAALLGSVDHPAALKSVSLTGGRLNAARALGVDVGPDGEAPAAPSSLTAVGSPGRVDLTWTGSNAADLRDYRVWREVGGSWIPVETSTIAAAALTGLASNESITVRVTARDRSGEESTPSASVTLLPSAGQVGGIVPTTPTEPAPTATSPTATTPGPRTDTKVGDGTAVGTPATGGVTPVQAKPPTATTPGATTPILTTQLANLRASKVRGRVRGIRFHLSSAATVRILATRARTTSRPALSRRKTVPLDAGEQYLTVARTARGLGLATGQWRVTVTAGAATRTVSFRVS